MVIILILRNRLTPETLSIVVITPYYNARPVQDHSLSLYWSFKYTQDKRDKLTTKMLHNNEKIISYVWKSYIYIYMENIQQQTIISSLYSVCYNHTTFLPKGPYNSSLLHSNIKASLNIHLGYVPQKNLLVSWSSTLEHRFKRNMFLATQKYSKISYQWVNQLNQSIYKM